MQIQEEDYFCHVTHRTWDAILHAIREAHKDDTDSAPEALREVVHCALPGASPLLRRPEQQMISVDFQSAPIITG